MKVVSSRVSVTFALFLQYKMKAQAKNVIGLFAVAVTS